MSINQLVSVFKKYNDYAQLDCGHLAPDVMGHEDCKTKEEIRNADEVAYCFTCDRNQPKLRIRNSNAAIASGKEIRLKELIRYCYEQAVRQDSKVAVRKMQKAIRKFDGKIDVSEIKKAFQEILSIGQVKEEDLMGYLAISINVNKDLGVRQLKLTRIHIQSQLIHFYVDDFPKMQRFGFSVEINSDLHKRMSECGIAVSRNGVYESNRMDKLDVVLSVLMENKKLLSQSQIEEFARFALQIAEPEAWEMVPLPKKPTQTYGTFRPIRSEEDDLADALAMSLDISDGRAHFATDAELADIFEKQSQYEQL